MLTEMMIMLFQVLETQLQTLNSMIVMILQLTELLSTVMVSGLNGSEPHQLSSPKRLLGTMSLDLQTTRTMVMVVWVIVLLQFGLELATIISLLITRIMPTMSKMFLMKIVSMVNGTTSTTHINALVILVLLKPLFCFQ